MPHTPEPEPPLLTVTGHTLVLAQRYDPYAPPRTPHPRHRPRARTFAFARILVARLRARSRA
ncbi:hypothetical protein [Streptomyces sp. NPDC059479]|uniref:hypothetical protein n=1 Tax=Streptomyces sp. NPDC059479 TaxID=3346848 RepID=UPI0036A40AFD